MAGAAALSAAVLATGVLAHACTAPGSSDVLPALSQVAPGTLVVTAGSIVPAGPSLFEIRDPSFRAVVGREPRRAVEVHFVYRGPSAGEAPLASGELRRQIGLKLRAKDGCNVVYVMWRIAPAGGLAVSVKSNPGESASALCGDRGYEAVPASFSREIAHIGVGEAHVLRADLRGDRLEIAADGVSCWKGALPPAAAAFDGPVGLRSDNGSFDVEVRTTSGTDVGEGGEP